MVNALVDGTAEKSLGETLRPNELQAIRAAEPPAPVEEPFIPQQSYLSRKGYVFKLGDQGLGLYKDARPEVPKSPPPTSVVIAVHLKGWRWSILLSTKVSGRVGWSRRRGGMKF